eukprot:NODE_505_length_2168_cov_27.770175_g463_i0.p1 GENE.NODE_505_length_2168_cov_27.770175_g463_i0~~NODE_505_length_2168_cov_27.770175_g463_i0.p1  ORF type:complete len:675 (+),score=114.40 NODE_505_length_2168_cov_27.770175_g463_i0:228-2027(+)
MAAIMGHTSIVELLLSHRAPVDQRRFGWSALALALAHHQEGVAVLLAAQSHTLTLRLTETPQATGTSGESRPQSKWLHPTDALRLPRGSTVLHAAAHFGLVHSVKAILQRCSEAAELRTEMGQSAADLCAPHLRSVLHNGLDYWACLRALSESAGPARCTALEIALRSGVPTAVQGLGGWTPLMAAAALADPAAVQLLLSAGDASEALAMRMPSGISAALWAHWGGAADVVAQLAAAGLRATAADESALQRLSAARDSALGPAGQSILRCDFNETSPPVFQDGLEAEGPASPLEILWTRLSFGSTASPMKADPSSLLNVEHLESLESLLLALPADELKVSLPFQNAAALVGTAKLFVQYRVASGFCPVEAVEDEFALNLALRPCGLWNTAAKSLWAGEDACGPWKGPLAHVLGAISRLPATRCVAFRLAHSNDLEENVSSGPEESAADSNSQKTKADLLGAVHQRYRIGCDVQFRPMTHASSDMAVAVPTIPARPVVFKLHCKTARSLDAFSPYPGHSPVVLLPGTHFRVASWHKLGRPALSQGVRRRPLIPEPHLASHSVPALEESEAGQTDLCVVLQEIEAPKTKKKKRALAATSQG